MFSALLSIDWFEILKRRGSKSCRILSYFMSFIVVVVRHWNIAVGWFALLGYGWFWQLLWFYNSLVIFRYQPKFYQIQKNILDGTKRQLLRIKKRYNLFEMEFPTFWWSRGEGRIWRQIMHAYLIFILSKSPYKSELFFKR